MENAYSIVEFAEIVGVTQVTVRKWIKDGIINVKYTKTGQPYFEDEQVAYMFIHHRMKAYQKTNSGLYIVCGNTQEEIDKLIELCFNTQKQIYPKSVFIKDFTTFFTELFSKVSFDDNSEESKKMLKYCALTELSKRLKDYVDSKLISILDIDERYSDNFTPTELKQLILNYNVTDELKERFNDIARDISENPNDKQINMDGTLKISCNVTAKSLELLIDNKVMSLIQNLGITGINKKDLNYKQLLDIDNVFDEKTIEVIFGENVEINITKPAIKTIIKDMLLKTKGIAAKKQISNIETHGYYHVFRYDDTDRSKRALYRFIDEKLFKNVYVVGSASDILPSEITLKLEAQNEVGAIHYAKI